MTVRNEPIAYDDHGDIPFHVPFRELSPPDVSIYLQLNTKVGRSTCRQACTHCFFINQPQVRGRSMDLTEGRAVMDDLAALGYRVFPMISDSFANGGEFLRSFGDTHNRDLRQGPSRDHTKTMERGELWTSGAPLLDPDWPDLLRLAVEQGFGSVTITFHGLFDENLELLPPDAYPIGRVFPGRDCRTVIDRIAAFNTGPVARAAWPLQINIGVTIGSHNHTRDDLLRYVRYFAGLPIDVLRFNCFHDHGGQHPHLTLSPAEVAAFYRDLRDIHDTVALPFQLGVDEDFGTSGIEVMGFPAHTGWCRAGRQLFAAVPEPPEELHTTAARRVERIGTVAACVDAFQPVVGDLRRTTDLAGGAVTHDIDFFHDVIDDLNHRRVTGAYSDGCYAPEMLADPSPPRAQPR
ncbi:hypothetical protein [Actinoplanes sp. NBRC 103695]|uniref:hypothetical protein n=1 Tax=Actinoplanes sp. NBRC 103695 TaxID=3032202 RepID=UPI0024A1A8DC|nr:hypothetical protein [Actinoplanes sp. NBRC 103695]GLY99623.1 hypothetical protein Acsp02_68760 [Actinoplanes sp. NBRC 103695]